MQNSLHYFSQIWSPRHFHYMLLSQFENLPIQGIMPVFFDWRLLKWLRSYDGIIFCQLKAHEFIHSRQKLINSYTCILWGVITRGMINSVCSPLVCSPYTLPLSPMFGKWLLISLGSFSHRRGAWYLAYPADISGIHTLKLYRTSLYLSPSLVIKKQ